VKLFRIRLQGRFRTVRRVVLIHLVNMGEAVTLLEPRRYLWQASSGAFWWQGPDCNPRGPFATVARAVRSATRGTKA
jgi:hypothetical protein